MPNNVKYEQARAIMRDFALATGLTGDLPARRYLWTDAHAVSNYLALEAGLPGEGFIDLALDLIRQVHAVLGRFRPDDKRVGWISGLDEDTGTRHPTAGGLRIGKLHPERTAREPYDAQAEWERDGQYYHYLTKWMHALHQTAAATGRTVYADWARELAAVACQRFRSREPPHRLVWKMSTDLSRPLVSASGQADALDGLVTAWVLQEHSPAPELEEVVTVLAPLCDGQPWMTDDPLGIGGLLFDAARVAQLPVTTQRARLLQQIVSGAVEGLAQYLSAGGLSLPAGHRLAFRELGLAIGVQGADLIRARYPHVLPPAQNLATIVQRIEQFWAEPAHQQQATWQAHKDINAVMLATSLLAPAFLHV